jgi:energy-coupling factor transporter ATP-binding protein EcfA2
MTSQTATTFWEIPQNLKYDEPIDENSPFFVDTAAARGHFSFRGIYKSLFIDPVSMSFKNIPPQRVYQLFLGHRGCGKSTELRRLKHKLHHPDRFFVVFLDALNKLDINNLGYADILLALAASLSEELAKAQIDLPEEYIKPLVKWFDERVETHNYTKDYAAEIKAGLTAKSGLPFLAELFATITTSLRINSTYKEEVRTVLTNSFSQFSSAFNILLSAAEEALIEAGKGRSLLFVIDGTDRLRQEDHRRFFINEAHQLQQIEGNFIYCAPIQLANEEGQVNEAFKTFILPMVKVREKQDPTPLPDAYTALRELVYKRINDRLFDAETTVDYLITHSGGNPRHLIRLLDYAFQETDGEILDNPAAERAVKHLANDLRRILNTDDYALLARIDSCDDEINDDKVRRLLYNLALLEYNSYWRLTHPAVQTLAAYQYAKNNLGTAGGG